MSVSLQPTVFEALDGWRDDDPTPVVRALARSAEYCRSEGTYRPGALGITVDDMAEAMAASAALDTDDPRAARALFETHFRPFRIRTEKPGLVTGFYEPEIAASRRADDVYRFAFYRRPADLIKVDPANGPTGWDRAVAFGRQADGCIVEYADRAAIDDGFLDGRALEIAYAADRVDVFFAHIQGAARLSFADGSSTRITYAAKTGHAFTAIGAVLATMGEIDAQAVTMTSIRAWLAAHPDRADGIMRRNRSYIFFRETPMGDPGLGPIAAAKVQLTPGRSLAVDRHIHTFATPFFIDAPDLAIGGSRGFRRLMLAQDTGSAILGPARGDIFVGTGAAAGCMAGAIRHRADFFAFIPRAAVARLRL